MDDGKDVDRRQNAPQADPDAETPMLHGRWSTEPVLNGQWRAEPVVNGKWSVQGLLSSQ